MLIGLEKHYTIMKKWTMISLCIIVLVATIPSTFAYTQTTNTSKTHIVYITGCATKDSCFIPCQITIPKGGTVTWVNLDTVNHMIISGSGQHGPDGWFSSPVIFSHGTFSHQFDRKGAFPYYDSTNTYAQGVVIVDSPTNSNFVKLQQSYYSNWWCTR